jgi:nitrate/TMAO reductase-like tetraheme cytochrome c subunit
MLQIALTIILVFSFIQLIVILAVANFIVKLANSVKEAKVTLDEMKITLDELSQFVVITNRRRTQATDQGLMDISTPQVPYDERLLRP